MTCSWVRWMSTICLAELRSVRDRGERFAEQSRGGRAHLLVGRFDLPGGCSGGVELAVGVERREDACAMLGDAAARQVSASVCRSSS